MKKSRIFRFWANLSLSGPDLVTLFLFINQSPVLDKFARLITATPTNTDEHDIVETKRWRKLIIVMC